MSEQYQLHPKGESYVYDSLEELLERLHGAESSPVFSGRASFTKGSAGWYGTSSYAEAVSLAREGWVEPVRKIETIGGRVEARIDTSIIQTSFASRFDVCGGEVDIARYLDGDHECMIESDPIRISRHGRAVRVAVPGGYLAYVSEAQVLGRGAAVVALADALIKAQHPLEVYVSYEAALHQDDLPLHQTLVRVQRADEPIDIGRLAFMLCHRASFRRIGFRALEVTAKSGFVGSLSNGYGRDPCHLYLGQLSETANTVRVPRLEGDSEWDNEDFCTQWVNEQLDRIFD